MWRYKSPVSRSIGSPSPSSSREGSRSPDNLEKYRQFPHHHDKEIVKVGERVIIRSTVGDAKTGILRYVGKVEFAEGLWAGVELFYPQGRNDGTVLGIEYFQCKHPYGIFVPLRMVDPSPVNRLGVNTITSDEEEDGKHYHLHGVMQQCELHDRVLWNTEAQMGHKMTGVRNPAL